MGVDLGNLEVVLLSSVPPMPANTNSVLVEADVITKSVVLVLPFVVLTQSD
jgi:hypothetical protein